MNWQLQLNSVQSPLIRWTTSCLLISGSQLATSHMEWRLLRSLKFTPLRAFFLLRLDECSRRSRIAMAWWRVVIRSVMSLLMIYSTDILLLVTPIHTGNTAYLNKLCSDNAKQTSIFTISGESWGGKLHLDDLATRKCFGSPISSSAPTTFSAAILQKLETFPEQLKIGSARKNNTDLDSNRSSDMGHA